QNTPGHGHSMHFIGAVVNASESRLPVHSLERCVWSQSFGAEHLDGPVDCVVQHRGPDDFDYTDFYSRGIALVELMGGVERQQAARLNLSGSVENHILDRLLLRERRSERHAIIGAVTHKVERPLCLAQPAHAMEDAAWAKPLLGDHEPVSSAAQQVFGGHANVVIYDLAMAAPHTEHWCLSHDLVARSAGGHDYHAECLVRGGVWLGANHHGCVGSAVRPGRKPFAAINYPVITVKRCGSLELRRVRASDIGLGHGEARKNVPIHQRPQVKLAPPGRRVQIEHYRILKRDRTKRRHRVLGPPDHLVYIDVIQERESLPADFSGVPQRPQAFRFRLVHQAPYQVLSFLIVALIENRFNRVDSLFDELFYPCTNRPDMIGDFKTHPVHLRNLIQYGTIARRAPDISCVSSLAWSYETPPRIQSISRKC